MKNLENETRNWKELKAVNFFANNSNNLFSILEGAVYVRYSPFGIPETQYAGCGNDFPAELVDITKIPPFRIEMTPAVFNEEGEEIFSDFYAAVPIERDEVNERLFTKLYNA